jgi:hypothetical protein
MIFARADESLTLLTDGRALALGGDNATSVGEATRGEAYDPSTHVWLPTAASPMEHRSLAASVRLSDGRVLLVGGLDTATGGAPAVPAAIYDPSADSWAASTAPPVARVGATATLLTDGRVLLVGGKDPSLDSTEVFDPGAGTWSDAGTVNGLRGTAQVVALPQGRALLSSPGNSSEIWSPGSATWTSQGSGGVVSTAGLVALSDGEVLSISSPSVSGGYQSERAHVFDPVLGTWRFAGQDLVPVVDGSASVALGDDRVVTLGGGTSQDVIVHIPTSDLWLSGGVLQQKRVGVRAVAIAGGVLVVGGPSAGAADRTVELVPFDVGSPPASTGGEPAATLSVSSALTSPGEEVVVGHLMTGDHVLAAGEQVSLYRRGNAARDWSLLGTETTDLGGMVMFAGVSDAGSPVLAMRHAGNSAVGQASPPDLSELATASLTGVPRPDAIAEEAGQDVIRASWDSPAYNADQVTGYIVVATDVEGGIRTRIASVGPEAREATVRGLQVNHSYTVELAVQTASYQGYSGVPDSRIPLRTEPGRRLAGPVPPGESQICGLLPLGTTRLTAAQGVTRICHAGVVVPAGAALVLDGSAGPLKVLAGGAGGIHVLGGDLRTENTSASARVSLGAGDPEQRWSGVLVGPGQQLVEDPALVPDTPAPLTNGVLDLKHVDLSGSTSGFMGEAESRFTLSDVSTRNVRGVDVFPGAPVGNAVNVYDGDADLQHLDIATTDRGVASSCQLHGSTSNYPAVRSCRISLSSSTLDGVVGSAVNITDASVHLHDVSITHARSEALLHGAEPAVLLSRVALPGDAPLANLQGGDDALPSVDLSHVTFEGAATWQGDLARGTSSSPKPLSWIGGGVVVAKGASVSVGANATAAFSGGGLVVQGGTLTLDQGSALTSIAAVPALCQSALANSCAPQRSDWAGVTLNGATLVATGTAITWADVALDVGGGEGTVTNSDLGPSRQAVRAVGHGAGSLSFVGGSVHDAYGPGLTSVGLTSLSVTGTTFTDTGVVQASGASPAIERDDRYYDVPTVAPVGADAGGRVAFAGVTLERTGGLQVNESVHPSLRSLVVRDTALSGRDGPSVRAVTLHRDVLDLSAGGDVQDVNGAQNGVDAIAIDGLLTTDTTWVSPEARDQTGRLGWVIGSGVLRLTDGGKLVLPKGALVKSDPLGSVRIDRGFVDGTAGGAVLTGTGDSSHGLATCQFSCDPSWNGVVMGIPYQASAVSLSLSEATVRGGPLSVTARRASGEGHLVLNRVNSDNALLAAGIAEVQVRDSRADRIDSAGAVAADIERDVVRQQVHVHGQENPGYVPPYGTPADQTALVLRDTTVTGGTGPAFWVAGQAVSIGPGQGIDRLVGRGSAAVLFLDSDTVTAPLTWATPSPRGDLHRVGIVAASLKMSEGRDLTVPPGSVVKASDLGLVGGALTIGPGSIVVTPYDDSVGIRTCRYPYVTEQSSCPGTSNPVYYRTTYLSVLAGSTGNNPTTTITSSRIDGDLDLANGTGTVDSSSIGNVSTPAGAVQVSNSQLSGFVASGGHLSLNNTLVDQLSRYSKGLQVSAGDLTTHGVVLAADPRGAGGPYTLPIDVSASAAANLDCTDIEGRSGGITTGPAASLTVTSSTLTANAGAHTFDLDNTGPVTSTHVWWGQSGGPIAGQVRHPALLNNTQDLTSAPTCATASPAAPLAAATEVTATPFGSSARVTWKAPTDDRLQSYQVTARPGGESVTAESGATSADVGGLPTGSAQRFVVTAHYAAADVPSIPSVAVTSTGGPPVLASFTVPPFVTSAPTTVSAQGQPGTTVTFAYGSSSGVTAVVDENGVATTVVDASGSADGPLTWSATPVDVAGTEGSAVTAQDTKDTTAPTLTAHAELGQPVSATVQTEAGAVVGFDAGFVNQSGRLKVIADDQGLVHYADAASLIADGTQIALTSTDAAGNTSAPITVTVHRTGTPVRGGNNSMRVTPFVDRTDRTTVHPVQFSPQGHVHVTATAVGGSAVSRDYPASTPRDELFLDVSSLADGPLALTVEPQDGLQAAYGVLALRAGPDVVQDLVATAVSGGYDLAWRAPQADPGHPVQGYGVAVENARGDVSVHGISAQVRNLPTGSDVTITVVARSAGIPGLPTRVTVHTAGPTTAPYQPEPDPYTLQPTEPTPTSVAAISSGPAPSSTTASAVSFGVRASGSFTSTTCTLDGVSRPCTGYATYSGLRTGPHTFRFQSDTSSVVSRTWNVDATGPSSRLSAPAAIFTTAGHVVVSAIATDSGGGRVVGYRFRVRKAAWNGTFGGYALLGAESPTGRMTAGLATGFTYCFSSQARDGFKNLGAWSTERCTARPLDDRALRRSSGWTTSSSRALYGNSSSVATRQGATMTLSGLRGGHLAVLATRCVGCGSLDVLVGNVKVATISLAARGTSYQALVALPPRALRASTIVLRVSSSGKRVEIDGLGVFAN